MSGSSAIEWTDATWNPLTGCSLVSEGCRNCYAAREAAGRLSHHPAYAGLAEIRAGRAVFTGEIRLQSDRLTQPWRWRKPRRIFVNSMSDLFHPDVPVDFIDSVFGVMGASARHTFQVLTKRPERMAEYLNDTEVRERVAAAAARMSENGDELHDSLRYHLPWPFANVWLGTSVEDQKSADKRVPHLLDTPAAVRFLSCEPLLGPVDLDRGGWSLLQPLNPPPRSGPRPERIHWVIVGGESGPNARPMHPDWAHQIRDQCRAEGVAFHFKQWGEWGDGSNGKLEWVLADDGTLFTADAIGYPDGPRYHEALDKHRLTAMSRVGKKTAGRELDFRTYDEYPEVKP